MLDLDAYYRRIGNPAGRAPTLSTLQRLQALHPQHLPFENLSPLLGEPVLLDLDSLQGKLIHRGRGGYCFEHNLLFKAVLDALGFKTRALGARVRWNVPEGLVRPRTHMLLLLDLDGAPWIADTGFGGNTLTAPLRLEAGTVQQTPHGPYRLLREGEGYRLEAEIAGEWKALYFFELQEQHLADYEMASWYLSHHPQSHFVTDLIVARPDQDGRHVLANNQYTRYPLGGSPERRTLRSAEQIKQLLAETFLIEPPRDRRLDEKLDRLIEAAPQV